MFRTRWLCSLQLFMLWNQRHKMGSSIPKCRPLQTSILCSPTRRCKTKTRQHYDWCITVMEGLCYLTLGPLYNDGVARVANWGFILIKYNCLAIKITDKDCSSLVDLSVQESSSLWSITVQLDTWVQTKKQDINSRLILDTHHEEKEIRNISLMLQWYHQAI